MAAVPIPNTPHPTPLGEDPVLWLRLIRSRRVGPVTFHRLVAEYGGIAAALDALPDIARAAGIEGYHTCPAPVALAEMSRARAAGAVMLRFGAPDYPAALTEIPDAPPVLWARGDLALLNRPGVALVGARNASSLGLRMARRLATSLGEAGQVVISGLARGIDAEAHLAALTSGTVAVLAGGIDIYYPDENAALAAEIAEKGCLVTEQPPGCEPQARHFPLRNRIVSGLARAVVVVEAASKSGSLLTARAALDQGREVLAVPGHPFDPRAAGCNQLIRDGAALVRGAADVIEVVGRACQGAGQGAGQGDRQGNGQRGLWPVPSDPAPAPAITGGDPRPPHAGGDAAGRAGADSPVPQYGRVPSASIHAADVAAPAMPGRAVPARTDRTKPPPARHRAGAAAHRSIAADDIGALILDRLGLAPLAEDQLIRDLALPVATFAPAVLALELDGRVERHPGGLLSLSPG